MTELSVSSIGNLSISSFLSKTNIFGIIIASMISSRINELVESFINHLLVPIIDLFNKKKSITNQTIKLFNTDIKIGLIILALCKLLLVMILVVIIIKSLSLNKIN